MSSNKLPKDPTSLFKLPSRVHMMDQRSPEWHQIRKGKVTGSEAHRLFPKRGTWERLVTEKACESIGIDWRPLVRANRAPTMRPTAKSNVEHVIRGTLLEPEVREHYRRLTDSRETVFEVGFVQYQRQPGDERFHSIDPYCGCSPDGFNLKDGVLRLIEIKCPSDDNFQKVRDVPESYRLQMAFNCLICGVRCCDFIVFNRELGMSIRTISFGEDELNAIGGRLESCVTEIIDKAAELTAKIALDNV